MTSVILGVRTREQLADNLGAAKVKLTAEEMETLNRVSAPQMSDYPYGERGVNQRFRKMEGGR